MYGFHNGRNVLGLRWPVLLLVLGSLAFGAGCGDFTLFDDDDGGPCAGDPCAEISHAVKGSCVVEGTTDFTCECDTDYVWNDGNDQCVAEAQGTCADLKTCLTGCDVGDDPCKTACAAQWTGCDCGEIDPANPPSDCAFDCLTDCSDPLGQACYVCLVGCGIDTYCQ